MVIGLRKVVFARPDVNKGVYQAVAERETDFPLFHRFGGPIIDPLNATGVPTGRIREVGSLYRKMRKGCVKPSQEIRRTVVCLFLVAFAALLIVSCGDDNPTSPTSTTPSEFVQILSLPTMTTWEKVWGAPTGEVFLMGEDGVIFRKNGDAWDSLNSGPSFDRKVHSVWGVRGDNLYFVGRITDRDTTFFDSTVDSNITVDAPDKPFITQYNGLNFADAPISGIDWGLYDIWGSSESNIYAVGYNGTVVHYDGSSWNVELTDGTSPTFLTSVWGADSANMYAGGSGGALLNNRPCEANPDSLCWNVLTTHSYHALWDVWGLSDTSVYMAGTNGTIINYNSTDSIMTKMETGVNNSLYSIWGTAEDNLYAVGWGGKIIHYNGSLWTEEDAVTNFGFLSVWGTADDDIYAAGQTVLHYDGVTWSPVTVRNEPDFNDMWAGTDGSLKQVVTVGSGGHIMRSAGTEVFYAMTVDGGSITTDLNGVGGFVDTAWFVVGDAGTTLMRDESDLTNWVTISSGVSENLNSVACLSRSLAYAVGDNGTVLKYDGSDWTSIPGLTTQNLNDVFITTLVSDTSVWIVGDAGTVILNSQGVWDSIPGAQPVNLRSVHGTSIQDVYAVGDGGTFLPLYTLQSGWIPDPISSEDLTGIWAVFTTDGGRVFVTGTNGQVMLQTAGVWSTLDSKVGVGLRCVYGLSATDVYVGGDCNHLLHYRP